MTQELTVLPPPQIVDVSKFALSIEAIVSQRELIKQCMAKAMTEGQHYGKIDGCGPKPTLLQPGAQLLAHLFRLRPEYEIMETDLEGGHKRFRINCRLFVMGSVPPIPIAQGVGEASSMESKHRFRNAAKEIRWTEDSVPAVYWNLHRKDKETGGHTAQDWLKNSYDGANMGTKKNEQGAWVFVEYLGGNEDKVENPNPSDVFNTVLKMAKKRAFVDSTITATASSDFFSQDLEDIRDNVEATRSEKVADATEVKASAPGATNTPTSGTTATGHWGDVVCTYGKAKGPLRGKKLGDLNDTNLKYLADMFLVEGKHIKDGDRKMVAALAIWQATGRKDSTPAPKESEFQFNGKHHERLYEQIVWDSLKVDDFMAAMKAAKLIPEGASSFAAMSDETAKKFVDDWENSKLMVTNYLETK